MRPYRHEPDAEVTSCQEEACACPSQAVSPAGPPALRKQLTALGMDSDALCQSAGIDLNRLSEANAQFSPDVTATLWQRAVQASLDPALGLRVSRFVSPTAFHALGYTLVASGSLREVFERIVRYRSMAEDSLELDFRTVGERYEFRFGTPSSCQSPVHELLDAFAAIYVRTCRNRLGRGYAPLAVHLQRPAPEDPQPWHDLFSLAGHVCGAGELAGV